MEGEAVSSFSFLVYYIVGKDVGLFGTNKINQTDPGNPAIKDPVGTAI
ncbi:hypothetical protein QNI16_28690 [Cytophagaceae bacterium YF14B1]|uniref:Uncharacterized protein n=1 Tax=Xanthocytophaga flava TaxID=3048013 RepID=A0AAE3QWH5_9BACT|nr:hypothetical protein [Xanthocytophaga flavus]MDJ1484510.1 hypothetical protein [Xanthocytophaga flavus]